VWYRLEGKIPVPCSVEEASRDEWESNKVAETIDDDNGTRVSTIFLRLNHNFTEEGLPVLFETMVFLKDEWAEQEMYHGLPIAGLQHRVRIETSNHQIRDQTTLQ